MIRRDPRIPCLDIGQLPSVIGSGTPGGKGRGLGFANSMLDTRLREELFHPHRLIVPDTTVIGTDAFEEFVDRHELHSCLDMTDDEHVKQAFLSCPLPEWLTRELRGYLEKVREPIAVRSSSLNEDAYNHPFAGLFMTLFLPNCHPDVDVRLRQLDTAVRMVYSSTYYQAPKSYMARNMIPVDAEKMAIVLQRVVGVSHGNRFYPDLAGVAQGRNYFAIRTQKAEDGIAFIVVGLGKQVVDGYESMRFCPASPLVRPHFTVTSDVLKNTQKRFTALNLQAANCPLISGSEETLSTHELDIALADGVLHPFASTYNPQDRTIVEGTLSDGLRIASFNRVLRGEVFPLPKMLSELLVRLEKHLQAPVDMEFAVLLDRDGPRYQADFYLLQVRPLVAPSGEKQIQLPDVGDDRLIVRSHQAMGHGARRGIQDLVFIPPGALNKNQQGDIIRAIADINAGLNSEQRQFALLGPGRWGSSNPQLGIPVTYSQISQAVVIAELNTHSFSVMPSQGTHFFHNITSGNIFYLSVDTAGGDVLNLGLIDRLPLKKSVGPVRHHVVPEGLRAVTDGASRTGLIFLPAAGQ